MRSGSATGWWFSSPGITTAKYSESESVFALILARFFMEQARDWL